MNFRGHGTAVAVIISVLALAAGGTGAAVAVTSTVTISDSTNPGRIAHVDGAGRLTTVGVTNTISIQSTFFNAGVINLTAPTNASLAITQVALSETRMNAGVAGSELTVRLVQNGVDAGGACTTTATRYIALTALSAGDHVDLASAAPLVIKAVGGAKYCLGIYSTVTNGAADATTYYPYVTFGAYVAAGTYSGAALSAKPEGVTPMPAKKGN